jgi:hypothetical protein
MATFVPTDFCIPLTQRLADLTGAQDDLEAAESFCFRCISTWHQPPPFDSLLLECLCAAALVRYGRAFGNTVRIADARCVLDELTPDLKSAHKRYIAMRHQWIAHSVNTFEENVVVAYFVEKQGTAPRLNSVEVQTRRVVALHAGEMQSLADLAHAMANKLNALIAKEKARALEHALSLPAEFWVNRRRDSVIDTGKQDPATKRRRWRDPRLTRRARKR